MSQENVEIVEASYEAFARGGLDRYMEHFTDDVEYRQVLGEIGEVFRVTARTPCGHGLRTGSTCSTGSGWSWWKLIDAGGVTVFTAERFGGRARSSGVETDQANWTVFAIRDGKIARGHEYPTREQALEAAGLSE